MTDRPRFQAAGSHIWTEQERATVRAQAMFWRSWSAFWLTFWLGPGR